ncbi:MAG TPA: hypothetical protein VML75_22820 [Kofleriaceae bacterium]|nr:hypothetical protein [Kofleriaceae bacterium]
MSLHLRPAHIRLIARTHVRHSLRSGSGVVFLVLAILTGLVIAFAVITPLEEYAKIEEKALREARADADAAGVDPKVFAEQAKAVTEQAASRFIEKVGKPVVKRFTGADDEQAEYILVKKPALVSAFLILMVFFLPFIVALGAFNQTAGDIATKGLRYQLLRTERGNIFLGRLLGTYLFYLAVLAVLMFTVLIYLVAKARFYPTADVALWMLQGYVAMALYALPWIALCAWISCAIGSPFVSLIVSDLIIGMWPVVAMSLGNVHEVLEKATYLMPWGYKYFLIDSNVGVVLGGGAAMLGFSLLFTWLGLRHFQRRDL